MNISDKVWAMADALVRKGHATDKQSAVSAIFKQDPSLYLEYQKSYLQANSVSVLSREDEGAVEKNTGLTVKQIAEEGILEYARQIQERTGCEIDEAIGKAIDTPKGSTLYKATRDPSYARAPISLLKHRGDDRDAHVIDKAARVLTVADAILGELGAACDEAGIQRPVRKVLPFHKFTKARTFNEVLADQRSDLPPAA